MKVSAFLGFAALAGYAHAQSSCAPAATVTVTQEAAQPQCTQPGSPNLLQDVWYERVESYDVAEDKVFARPAGIDSTITTMVRNMSVREKAGQLSQLHAGALLGCNGEFNATKAEALFKDYPIGSILHNPGNVGSLYLTNTPEWLANFTDTAQNFAARGSSGIPLLFGIDSVHGANYVFGSTLFPQSLAVAASFNPDLAYEAGRINGKDTRAAGYHWTFTPNADLNTNKFWSRNFESPGEDPLLQSRMVAASVRGLQGDYKNDRSRIAACMKHWIAYGKTNSGMDRGSRWIPDNFLMEYFMPPFQAAIDAGVATAMESYSDVNSDVVVTSEFYMKTLLRDVAGFKGMVVTDWHEMYNPVGEHHTANDKREAVWQSLNKTSVDMNMVPEDLLFIDYVEDLVNAGEITEDRLDESVHRILQLKKDLGLFENALVDRDLIPTVGSKQDTKVAEDAVREIVTLLKNKNDALPIKDGERVLVVGPAADNLRSLNGAWTILWQGAKGDKEEKWYGGFGTTILEGMRNVTGGDVEFVQGVEFGTAMPADFDEVLHAAHRADKVVLVLGEEGGTETPGDVYTIEMPKPQKELVRALYRGTSAKLITVLVENHPLIMGDVIDKSDAIVMTYESGSWSGLPIAEVLYGKTNPSGRLPFTYPAYEEQAQVTYWQAVRNQYEPAFPFSAGLSYSNVTYSNLRLNTTEVDQNGVVGVEVTVSNHGPMDVKEPVLLFTQQMVRPFIAPEAQRLRDFSKIDLKVGETKAVKFELPASVMAFYDRTMEQKIAPGPVNITINAYHDNPLTAQFNLTVTA